MAAPDLKQARKVVQLMVLAAWADGRVAGSEAITIQKLVNDHPLFSGVGPIAELCRETRERMVEEGVDEVLVAVASGVRDRHYRELAFQCCARVMSADGIFAPEEEELLRKVQELFAMDVEEMRRLLVMATRHEA